MNEITNMDELRASSEKARQDMVRIPTMTEEELDQFKKEEENRKQFLKKSIRETRSKEADPERLFLDVEVLCDYIHKNSTSDFISQKDVLGLATKLVIGGKTIERYNDILEVLEDGTENLEGVLEKIVEEMRDIDLTINRIKLALECDIKGAIEEVKDAIKERD